MRGVLTVVALNLARARERKGYLLTTLALTLGAIFAAIYFTAQFELKGSIAYVSDDPAALPASQWFRIEAVEQAPPRSQLIRNRYDAVVIDQGDGQFEIITIKGDHFRQQLEQALFDPASFTPDVSGQRGVGARIVGYLTMFVLLSGILFMGFFAEDKASGNFRRTVTSPIGLRAYLSGQLLFNAAVLFFPIFVILVLLKEGLGVQIGFAYGQYALLLGLLTALATAFGLFMTATIEKADDALSLASAAVVLTSLLAGALYAFDPGGAFMKFFTDLLPQKSLMLIAQGLEQRWPWLELAGPLSHIVLVALLFATAGWWICQRRLRAGRY